MRWGLLFGMALASGAVSPLLEMTPPIRGLTVAELRDSFAEVHSGSRHEAIDIMKPNGTPVRAVVTGSIAKLFLSKPGGNTIYLFDKAEEYCYYYAHLERYSEGLKEGAHVEAGDVIGFVGATGNANARSPHLHFAIFLLGPLRQWWKGTAVDPLPLLK